MDRLRHRARALRNHATDAERHLWHSLRARQLEGLRFRRQVPIAGFIVDFVCPKARLIVVLDGGQHAERIDYDEARTMALQRRGYRVVRYWDNDALLDVAAVVEDIRRQALGTETPSQPPPSAPRKGEE